MKRTILLCLGALFLLMGVGACSVISYGVSANNKMVGLDENVKSQWSQVENVYQRRSDLIPNLVNVVKGYAKHENATLVAVAQARASAGQVKVNASDAASIAQFEQSQGMITQALSRLMVISEKYPELKADTHFSELQAQLEGTENRITVERQRFNDTAKGYNTYIRMFPVNLIANFQGFKERPYFQMEATAKTAPKVEF